MGGDEVRVDRNRIYLTGVSMGGCGSLAIGLPMASVCRRASLGSCGNRLCVMPKGFRPAYRRGVNGTERCVATEDFWRLGGRIRR